MPFDCTQSTTVDQLKYIRAILAKPENWCQHKFHDGDAHCIVGAIWIAGVDTSPYKRFRDPRMTYPNHLKRGQMPDACWFMRQALWKLDPASDGYVFKWNDAPERTHAEVLELIDLAIELAASDLLESADLQPDEREHALMH